jgi:hypothetical protein
MASIENDLLGGHDLQKGSLILSRHRGGIKSHHRLTVKPPRATRMVARLGEAGSFLANQCYGDGATADT